MGSVTPSYDGLGLPWKAGGPLRLLGVSRSIAVAKGCPQRGVLSPPPRSLVVDELLVGLNQRGIYAQGYADMCLLAKGKFPNTISGLMQWALDFVEKWCDERD
jgi:hypothetical protein